MAVCRGAEWAGRPQYAAEGGLQYAVARSGRGGRSMPWRGVGVAQRAGRGGRSMPWADWARRGVGVAQRAGRGGGAEWAWRGGWDGAAAVCLGRAQSGRGAEGGTGRPQHAVGGLGVARRGGGGAECVERGGAGRAQYIAERGGGDAKGVRGESQGRER